MKILNHDFFVEYVLSKFPEEACGVVCEGTFTPINNIAEDRRDTFRFDPVQFATYCDSVSHIVHSHTIPGHTPGLDPRIPSKDDMEGQVRSALPWAIVYCDGKTVSEPVVWGDPNDRPPLLEREFVFNAQDCLSLAADYLYQKHGIQLPECPRDWDWFMHGEDLIGQRWKSWGFNEVTLAEARASDVLLFADRNHQINHIGVYLGNNQLLHHAVNRLSQIDDASRYAPEVKFVIRHKDIQ